MNTFRIGSFCALIVLSAHAAARADESANGRPASELSLPAVSPSGAEQAERDGVYLTPTDRRIANCLVVDARAEAEIATVARTHAQDPRVRELADRIARDSAEFSDKIEQYIGAKVAKKSGAAAVLVAAETGPPDDHTSSEAKPRATSRFHPLNLQQSLMQVKQDLCDEQVRSLRAELESRPSAEFDRCYVAIALVRQMQMLDTLKVFSRHASPQFAEALAGASSATRSHLNAARALLSQPLETAGEKDGGRLETARK